MPCGYTARAELGVGALVLLTAGAVAFSRSSETKRLAGIFGAALGILAILYPAYIIGMCALADHTCRTMAQPTLLILGLGTIAVSAGVVWRSRTDRNFARG